MNKKLKKTFFDQNRFRWMEKEKKKWLRNLNLKKIEELQKSLLLFFDHHKSNFVQDNPVCYQMLLKVNR